MLNQDDLLGLIDRIYEAAADDARWPAVLREIADAFGAGEASLSAVSPTAVPWLVAPRTDPEFLSSYGAHYHPLNLFWRGMTRAPIGTAVTNAMVVPKETLFASEFFNDWSRPQGYLSVMGATLLAEDEWRVEFVVPGKREFGADHLKLYSAIAPHLKRAVQLNQRLRAAALDRTLSLAALDRLSQGVLIVDSKARVLFANAAADGAFGEGLKLVDGHLAGASSSETAALRLAIAARDRFDAPGDYVVISRGPNRPPLSLLVIPLRAELDWIAQQNNPAIVFINDPSSLRGPTDLQLRMQYGLTRAETALVRDLLTGASLQAAADRLGIRLATARTHLHRIFSKTRTTRQAELVRLMLASGHDARANANGVRRSAASTTWNRLALRR